MKQVNKGAETVEVHEEEKWVYDSSLDSKGRLPLRATTGAWKASVFIIAIEFGERLSYFGIATSLILYMTKVLHMDLKTAARRVNYWAGVTTLMPLFGGFLADAFLGRFSTVMASTIVYLLGLILLTLTSFVPSLKACDTEVCHEPRKRHELFFTLAIYLISIGTGGHKPSLESFGADQFQDDHPQERKKKMSFFNWWNFGLCCGLLLGVTLIVYVQDHVNWGAADIVLTTVMAFSLAIFVIGRPYYRYRVPTGSPLTPMLQVLVAAIAKRKVPYPSSSAQLYEGPQLSKGRLLCHTQKLKFLDKAAIIEDKENTAEKQSQWRLASVTQVEELKLIINMIPIWLSTIPFAICASQTTTFFIKQATTMNRNIGGFLIPPASIFSLAAVGMIIAVVVYEKILVPVLRHSTGTEQGIKILQRIGIGMFISVIAMVLAALVEEKRQGVARNNPIKGSLSMSVLWLAPQFIVIGIADGFALVGLQEYFYEQVPDTMRSLGIALYLSVLGAANFLSSFLITLVDHVTEKRGKSWFGKDLNSSQIDYWFWLLAGLTSLDLCVYVLLATRYTYKNVQRNVAVADCYHDAQSMA